MKLKLWKYPENYVGDDFSDYYIGLSRWRDSEALGKANFDAALMLLGGKEAILADKLSPQVIAPRLNHWLGGWTDIILVHKKAKKKIKVLEKIYDDLEAYPVLSDDLYSEYQDIEAESDLESYAREEAMNAVFEESHSDIVLSDSDSLLFDAAILNMIQDGYLDASNEEKVKEYLKEVGFNLNKYTLDNYIEPHPDQMKFPEWSEI